MNRPSEIQDLEQFRVMNNGSIVQLVDHVQQVVERSPDVQILIGSDSQNRNGSTTYATTVVFRYQNNGAHVLYKKEKTIRVSDLWTRLWAELERSITVADYLEDRAGIKVHQIDLDYNSDPAYASNKVWIAAVGYLRSMGYRSGAKPDLLIASWAANVICN